MFDRYEALAGRYDEFVGDDGEVRPTWTHLARALGNFDAAKLTERRWEMERLLLEHGVTYNVYADKNPHPRPWELDLLPLVFSSRSWRDVEVGIVQRAEVLRLILADIYGPQRLIQRGMLPAELIFRHPGFLLPCWGVEPALHRHLTIYAADLGRAPDGRIWVTEDRTQAPSGIGYALEARTIISRVLPSLFREANVHPVLPFLRALRGSLISLADDDPEAIAVLTPGSANETYSEHAYLARQLGLPLVEGGDLQVRNGRCHMLATDGIHPIRVLVRRLDDTYCEPLELNRQSVLGTPGVLQAVRNRQLCFANPLGSGVLENPGLLAYLPAICRAVLGEELKLPSVDSWWCGQREQLDYVLAHFDELAITRACVQSGAPRIAPGRLSRSERNALRERVRANPHEFAAQSLTTLASAPVLSADGVEGRCVEMRSFAVADGESFRVMAGGLARAAQDADNWGVSGQMGGICKDLWVLSSEPQRDAQILPQYLPRARPQQLRDPHIAENLLWLARYAQRCETLSRLQSTTLKCLVEGGAQGPVAMALCRALTWQTTLFPGFTGPEAGNALGNPVPELLRTIASDEAGALRGDCLALNRTAYPVRNLLTVEITTLLNRLDGDLANVQDLDQARPAVEITGLRLAALNGHLLRCLPDGGARRLIEIGLALEVALGTVRLLRSLALDLSLIDETGPLILALTNTTTGFAEGLELGNQGAVLHILLLADTNPCSVRHQLMILDRNLRSLSDGHRNPHTESLESLVASKLIELGALRLEPLLMADNAAQRLDMLLASLTDWLREIAKKVQQRVTPDRPAPASQLVRTA